MMGPCGAQLLQAVCVDGPGKDNHEPGHEVLQLPDGVILLIVGGGRIDQQHGQDIHSVGEGLTLQLSHQRIQILCSLSINGHTIRRPLRAPDLLTLSQLTLRRLTLDGLTWGRLPLTGRSGIRLWIARASGALQINRPHFQQAHAKQRKRRHGLGGKINAHAQSAGCRQGPMSCRAIRGVTGRPNHFVCEATPRGYSSGHSKGALRGGIRGRDKRRGHSHTNLPRGLSVPHHPHHKAAGGVPPQSPQHTKHQRLADSIGQQSQRRTKDGLVGPVRHSGTVYLQNSGPRLTAPFNAPVTAQLASEFTR